MRRAAEARGGDFATTTAGGRFSVACLVFNTIMNLTTQEAQVACFRNVAAQLEPGGCFVIEVMVPELRKLPPGQNVVPFDVLAGLRLRGRWGGWAREPFTSDSQQHVSIWAKP